MNVDASIGKRLPSGLVEGGPGDIVIENKHLAMAIAKVYNDPQLTQSTTGKVLDMAITGQPDQLDWINLPYVSTAEPLGGNSWQQLPDPVERRADRREHRGEGGRPGHRDVGRTPRAEDRHDVHRDRGRAVRHRGDDVQQRLGGGALGVGR